MDEYSSMQPTGYADLVHLAHSLPFHSSSFILEQRLFEESYF
jgi:hypothetical protein